MGPFHGSCEIIEQRDESNFAQHLKGTPLSSGPRAGNRTDNLLMGKMTHRYALEEDINKLFETINLKASARGLGRSGKLSTDSLRKIASKKSNGGGVSQASGIGISECATLKQALRGLCISHASDIAAMKRLSKPVVGSSKVSEVAAIKRLYRAVVFEANESGFPLDKGKGSLVEISLFPEQISATNISSQARGEKSLSSAAHPSPQFAIVPATDSSIVKAPQEEEINPIPTETGGDSSTMKLAQEGKLNSTLSLPTPITVDRKQPHNGNSTSIEAGHRNLMLKFRKNLKLIFQSSPLTSTAGRMVIKPSNSSPYGVKSVSVKKKILNKKIQKEPISACNCSDGCHADDNNGMRSIQKKSGGTHDCNQNVTKESGPTSRSSCLNVQVSISNGDPVICKSTFNVESRNKRRLDAKTSNPSRSREPADFSQSSESSVGEYSNYTCISEETYSCGSSCKGSRPHMSKDLRWDAIRRIEMEHGSLELRHFKLLKRLGFGDVGTVYLAELIETNCLFAVKIIDIDSLISKKKMSRAQTERDILQMLDHPFLPTLFAHFTTNKFSILVMEYCQGGDLHILRQKQSGRTFTEQAARFYASEVLLALEYLHMLGIVYRDLKPENILVREDGHIMLSDFDLSLRCTVNPSIVKTSSITTPTKKVSRPCLISSCIDPFCLQPSCIHVPSFTPTLTSTATKAQKQEMNIVAEVLQLLAEPTDARSNSFVGTHEYLAPEILRGEGHGNAVDWWTFGIFLYELLFGTTPFKGLGNDETLSNVVMYNIKFPESPSISSQAKDLISGLLIKEPQNRFGSVKGAAEVRQHPFFKGLNWALIRCAAPPVLPKSLDSDVLLQASEEKNLVEHQNIAQDYPKNELF